VLFNLPSVTMPRYAHLEKLNQGLGANALQADDGDKIVLKFRDWQGFPEDDLEYNTDDQELQVSLFSPDNPAFSFMLGAILILLVATLAIIGFVVTLKVCQYLNWRRKMYRKKAENLRAIIVPPPKLTASTHVPNDQMYYAIRNENFREDRLKF